MTTETFDYIVVGAGSAGCVLANRLTAGGGQTVLLLEAGPWDKNIWIHIPIGYYRTIANKELGWGYKTDPENQLSDRQIQWPRGKVIGGSSSVNGLVYIRGQSEDFNEWNRLGAEGWGWEDVLPYFKQAENQERGPSAFHGVGGPLNVSDMSSRTELSEAYIQAAVEAGIPKNTDFNGSTQEGVGYYQLNTQRGRRCSTSTAYLHPIMSRANLRVRIKALASRVLIKSRRAVGVEYSLEGQKSSAFARREIILCGGAINTPQLLQLSGIGAASELNRIGIPIVVDSPEVGKNLQDHLQVRSIYATRRPITMNDFTRRYTWKVAAAVRYFLFGDGPLTLGAAQIGVFARTKAELPRPDVQFHFMPFSADRPGLALHPFSAFTSTVCQLRPKSRGSISIRTSDPGEAPAIRANYLTDEEDVQTTLAGMQLSRRICKSPSLANLILKELEPGSDAVSEEQILAFVKQRATTIFHPCGTCRMGSDSRAVVDSQLRFNGIDALRIADASIMPSLISGNTNATVIMIAERAAKFIKET